MVIILKTIFYSWLSKAISLTAMKLVIPPSCFQQGFGSPHRSVGIRRWPEGSCGSGGFPLSDGKGRSVGHSALPRRSFWVNMVKIITLAHINRRMCMHEIWTDGQATTQSGINDCIKFWGLFYSISFLLWRKTESMWVEMVMTCRTQDLRSYWYMEL